jgi:hypothetical protein
MSGDRKRLQAVHDRLPNVFVVGAAKAATTSMCAALSSHVAVSVLDPKEPHYFSTVEVLPEHQPFFKPIRDRAKYEALTSAQDTPFIIDGSTSYLWDKSCAKRIAIDCPPQTRFVIMLRDPVERAYAHYLNNWRDGIEHRDFEDAVSAELGGAPCDWLTSYVSIGRYPEQLARYYETVPDRVHVAFAEDLREAPQSQVATTLGFLGLEPKFDLTVRQDNPYRIPIHASARLALGSGVVRRIGRVVLTRSTRERVYGALMRPGRKPTMDAQVRKTLFREYRSERADLEDVLGRRVPASWGADEHA